LNEGIGNGGGITGVFNSPTKTITGSGGSGYAEMQSRIINGSGVGGISGIECSEPEIGLEDDSASKFH
jgi:hypothetical protein